MFPLEVSVGLVAQLKNVLLLLPNTDEAFDTEYRNSRAKLLFCRSSGLSH